MPTETGINDGERRLLRHLTCVNVHVRVWTTEIETVIDIATPRRWLKLFEVYYEVVSTLSFLHSLACKAYFSNIFSNRASQLTVTLSTN